MLCKHYPEIKSYEGKHLGLEIQTKRIIPIPVVTLPPSSFLEKSEQLAHSYPTRFSSGNYRKAQNVLRKC